MYAIVATYISATDTEAATFRVRCGSYVTVHDFDHAARDASEVAIREHVTACPYCKRLTLVDGEGYELVFATLPTKSGKDGDTIAVWRYRE
jgi:hypothetical protein